MQVISWLLIGESLWTALWLTQRLGTLAVYDTVALTLLGARALTALAQFVAGWWLQRGLPPARTVAIVAFTASALLMVFELGFRFAPTSVVPGWEWIWVATYALYVAVAMAVLTRVPH